ncbi:MAG: histidine phosphatase family protein [Oscillochloridaceae bacterium umkhey_bin13]
MLTELYLIRHGLPLNDRSIPYHTPPGPALAEAGRREAALAAAFLAQAKLEHLFVSPFARTTQTAEVLLETLPLSVTFTSLIQEHGPGEQFDQVRSRMRELLAALHDGPHGCVGLVSHGSPIRAALLEVSHDKLDLSHHVYPGGNPAPTCGIWRVRFRADGPADCELIFRPQDSVTL